MLDEEGRVIWEPEAIIAIWERKLRSRTLTEYLVKWKNFPDEDASWEIEQFRQQYPSLPLLWGQSILKYGGNDMYLILQAIIFNINVVLIKT